MLVDRCIKISVAEEVKRILETETGDLDRFTVYGEDELRQVGEGTLTPTTTRPYCFVVSSKIAPAVTQLPFIAVDVQPIRKVGIELGNRNGRLATTNLNILGQTEGEVLDLSSIMLDGFDSRFPIRNHNDVAFSGFSPNAIMAYAEIVEDRGPTVQGPGPLAEQLIQEGSLFNWQIVNFQFRTLL